MKRILTDVENFFPWFYVKEKEEVLEKEVIECYDFEEISEEEFKILFDSKKPVR